MNNVRVQPPDIEQSPQPQPQNGQKKRMRVYEVWQGNERFFCWGYLVGGPNWKASLGTAALIAAPAGIYIAFVGVYLALEVNPVLLVVGCILPMLSILWLMLTAFRDPGIIPRQEPDVEYLSGQKPRNKEVYVNNHRVLIRYNDTCHFYQPPRAHHCSVNDNCIERFDHHCPWVGTTIGLRNYRTFLLFVYTTTLLCLYVFGTCLAQLFIKHGQLADDARERGRPTDGLWPKTLGKVIPALALMGFTFIFFWFVGGLSVFHAYLVASNQTTYENFRYNHDSRPNPYSRGILRNCAEVWCARTPPSKINFRAYTDQVAANRGQPASPYLDAAQMAILQGQQPASAGQPPQPPLPQDWQPIGGGGGFALGGGSVAPIDMGAVGAAGVPALPISSGARYSNGGTGGGSHYYSPASSAQQAAAQAVMGQHGAYDVSSVRQQSAHSQHMWQQPAPDPAALSPSAGGPQAAAMYAADLEDVATREDSLPPAAEPPAHLRHGTFTNQYTAAASPGSHRSSMLGGGSSGGHLRVEPAALEAAYQQ